MEFIRGLHHLRSAHRGSVVSIGNFDGVHLGHQQVIARLQQEADKRSLPSTLVVFEPQPREYFSASRAPARLSRLRDKVAHFKALGVDRVLCLPFNAALAQMPAETFVQQVLVDGLGAQFVVVGDDFSFGKDRLGTVALLQAQGQQHGFDVQSMSAIQVQQQRISSSQIRQALADADFATAERLLGRPYSIAGRVVVGEQRGRTIGVPTANIDLHRLVSPLTGVFIVSVTDPLGHQLYGVANLGKRLTLGGTKVQLEVHLFDCNRLRYGQRLKVTFLKKIREEQRFENFEALKQQIYADINTAKEYFAMMSE